MTKIAQLERALIEAGPRGLTRREVEALGLFAPRFVDERFRELAQRRRIRAEESRFRRRGSHRRVYRWIDLGPAGPLVDDQEPDLTLLPEHVGASPVSAVTGDRR